MDGRKKQEENSQKFNLRRIKSISGAEGFLEGLSQYNKMYPAFGKSTDKEFEDWRKEYKRFHLF